MQRESLDVSSSPRRKRCRCLIQTDDCDDIQIVRVESGAFVTASTSKRVASTTITAITSITTITSITIPHAIRTVLPKRNRPYKWLCALVFSAIRGSVSFDSFELLKHFDCLTVGVLPTRSSSFLLPVRLWLASIGLCWKNLDTLWMTVYALRLKEPGGSAGLPLVASANSGSCDSVFIAELSRWLEILAGMRKTRTSLDPKTTAMRDNGMPSLVYANSCATTGASAGDNKYTLSADPAGPWEGHFVQRVGVDFKTSNTLSMFQALTLPFGSLDASTDVVCTWVTEMSGHSVKIIVASPVHVYIYIIGLNTNMNMTNWL